MQISIFLFTWKGLFLLVSIFKQIKLTQFKNYPYQVFDFGSKIVGICGSNGSGKTNLLDSLYYLCFTRSYFTNADGKNALHGSDGFRLEAEVQNTQMHHLCCILRESGKKEFLLDQEPYKKFSAHIGKFSCVMIAPDDSQIITGLSELRRKFIDTLLSQLSEQYLQHLIRYQQLLAQRNSLLKSIAESANSTFDLLDIIDYQLVNTGNFLFQKRKEFLLEFMALVKNQYQTIAGKDEKVNLEYQSSLHNQDFARILQDCRQKDILLQRTTLGIHKDDLVFSMNGQPFKQLASQGQRKSLLFALKLSEFYTLKQFQGHAPILLLDDVFEKLDGERMLHLLQKVCLDSDAQVFITDTHKERLMEAFDHLSLQYQLIEL